MDDGLEIATRVRVGKDQRAQCRPVEVALGTEDVGPETVGNQRETRCAALHDLPGQQVGVYRWYTHGSRCART